MSLRTVHIIIIMTSSLSLSLPLSLSFFKSLSLNIYSLSSFSLLHKHIYTNTHTHTHTHTRARSAQNNGCAIENFTRAASRARRQRSAALRWRWGPAPGFDKHMRACLGSGGPGALRAATLARGAPGTVVALGGKCVCAGGDSVSPLED